MAARGIDAMVERQGRRFELERRDQLQQAAPCIALSRLPRSGAADLGQRLAAQLEALRTARGEDVLHVNLVGQSGGGRIAGEEAMVQGPPPVEADAPAGRQRGERCFGR